MPIFQSLFLQYCEGIIITRRSNFSLFPAFHNSATYSKWQVFRQESWFALAAKVTPYSFLHTFGRFQQGENYTFYLIKD